ncbi:MAG: AtpZ/AtpI family protein [Elusimicrobia bacterium]|nr:AtpZ/AtpI family protein [Elusimicrobiota bacterium]
MPTEPAAQQEARRRSWALAVSVGWELASFSLLGFGLGYWIDGRWGSSPWGILVSTLFGIVLGLYRVVRGVLRAPGGDSSRR